MLIPFIYREWEDPNLPRSVSAGMRTSTIGLNTARLTEFVGGGKQGEQGMQGRRGMQGTFCVAVFFEIGIRNIQNPRSIAIGLSLSVRILP